MAPNSSGKLGTLSHYNSPKVYEPGTCCLMASLLNTYLKRLLSNASVVRYLAANRPEYLPEFQNIVDMESTGPVSQ
ncbi:hypothetical protein [Brucella pituitosa]